MFKIRKIAVHIPTYQDVEPWCGSKESKILIFYVLFLMAQTIFIQVDSDVYIKATIVEKSMNFTFYTHLVPFNEN
jgi:hypothetical protein